MCWIVEGLLLFLCSLRCEEESWKREEEQTARNGGGRDGIDIRCIRWNRGENWRMLADCGRNRLIILLSVGTMIVL